MNVFKWGLITASFMWFSFVHAQTGGVGINRTGSAPDPSAIVDINDQQGGLLFPRMTEAQRNAIANPANALLIFNTTSRCVEMYNASSSSWQKMFCLCDFPPPPTPQPASLIGSNSFRANWTPAPGANSYYLDLARDSLFQNIIPGYNNLFVGSQNFVDLSNLNYCDSTLYYRLRSAVSCGSGSNSTVQSVKMGSCLFCLRVGTSNTETNGGSLIPLSDGSFIIAGNGYYQSDYDFFIARISPNKTLMWSKVFGGSSGEYNYKGVQTADGNLVFSGYTNSYPSPGNTNMYAVKIDLNGNLIWTKALGGSRNDIGFGLSATSDGGVVLSGYSDSYYSTGGINYDWLLVKLDANGNVQFTKTYGSSFTDVVYGSNINSSGEMVSAGYVYLNNTDYELTVFKLDASSNLVWSKRIGGSGNQFGMDATFDASGNIYAVGYTDAFGQGNQDAYVVKLDASGNLVWAKTYGLPGNEYFYRIMVDGQGNIICAGTGENLGLGGNDILLAKLDANGNILKASAIGGDAEDYFNFSGIAQRNNQNGYMLVGTSNSTGSFNGTEDFLIAQVDANLIGCCSVPVTLTAANNGTDNTYSVSTANHSLSINGSGGNANNSGILSIVCQ